MTALICPSCHDAERPCLCRHQAAEAACLLATDALAQGEDALADRYLAHAVACLTADGRHEVISLAWPAPIFGLAAARHRPWPT